MVELMVGLVDSLCVTSNGIANGGANGGVS